MHDDDDDWEECMGRVARGMTCERDIEIALRHGLAACDLIDELVPQQDLHLREGRFGERCEVLRHMATAVSSPCWASISIMCSMTSPSKLYLCIRPCIRACELPFPPLRP